MLRISFNTMLTFKGQKFTHIKLKTMESTLSRQSTQMESQMDLLSINQDLEEVKEAPVIVEDKHEKMMRELKETRARAAATIARSAELKIQIQDTLEKSMEVDRKFDQFKADFGNVMS